MLLWDPNLLSPTVFPPFFLGILQAPTWRAGWISVISSNARLVLSMYDMYFPTDTQFQNFAWLFKHRIIFSEGRLRQCPICFSIGTPFPSVTCSFCLSSTPLILHLFFLFLRILKLSLFYSCVLSVLWSSVLVFPNLAFNYKVNWICVLFLSWFYLSTALFI